MTRQPAHHDPALVTLVAAGGALGTAARAFLEATFAAPPGTWPWVTFLVNLSGAFVLGVLLQTLLLHGPDTGRRRALRLGGGTGFLGGYTTYSTFAVETMRMDAPLALTYALSSALLGAGLAAAGMTLAGRAGRGRDLA